MSQAPHETTPFDEPDALPNAPLDAPILEQPTETRVPPHAPVESTLASASVGDAGIPRRQSGVSIVRNTLVANLASLFSIATGFFLTPILLRALGTDTFGVWSLAVGMIGQLAIVQLGLNTAIPQQVAAKLALGDRRGLDKIFSTALAAYLICAAFSLLATGVLIVIAPLIFKVAPTQVGAIRWTLLILGVNQSLAFGVALRDALVFGSGRMFLTSSINIVVNLGITLGFIAMAVAGRGTVGMALVMLVATIVNLGLYQRLLSDEFSHLRPRRAQVSRETLARLLGIGRNQFAISLSGVVSFGVNGLILGLLLTPNALAYYALSVRLMNFIEQLSTKFSSVSLPVYSQAHAAGDVGQMRRIFTESITVAMGIVVPFLLVSLTLGERLITAWVGPNHGAAATLWALGMTTFLFRLPGQIAITILNGAEKLGLILKVYLAAAVVDVILSYFLTRQIGAGGVYIGSILVGAAVDFVWLPWFVCREFGFSPRAFWSDGLLPLLPSLLVGGAVALLIARLHLPPGTLVTLGATLVLLGSSWGTWFFVGLPASRRRRFANALRRALKRG